ncbi:metallophosphoesterase family protein [Bradyrhizobium cajani]|uniref:Metallophosphoesterase n=1 Tax=Bradyrhizobium cajani TaxID=1928661 RepID=A0A844TDN2_9BRAD|nr:metallophosphoesterase [Bradyrhizobium cajani]MCP3369201.1 metallophosphoesterase [Bradyrhizobium cajani]MVT74669.1 metallophosphoesterase [Bradyrhizobium cajani]
MDRSFVIVQISDLHLDGSGRLLAAIEVLVAAFRERMADFAHVPDRILLITGDLVDDPTPRALDEALAVIASFRQSGLFTDIQAVAGNHDVKRPSQRAGRHDAYDYLHLPRTSKSIYYRQAGLDLVLLDSNRASLATLARGIDQRAYSATVTDSARLSVELAGSLGSAGRGDYAEPAENLVRVLALHHHPLPQATGEGKRFLGAPDEPLMYLAAPATFLEAATSLNVNLVLHGHRHVEGLTRYSIPDPRATRCESGEAFWRTIYVLSCPSSTGQGGDDAGFNIVHFGPTSRPGRTEYRFAITRYSRPRNDGVFRLLDSNLPDGVIRLPAGRDYSRDPAFQSMIEIGSCATLTRDQVAALARRLLTRRAFYADGEPGWSQALHTYLVTSHAWADLDGKFARSGRKDDLEALAAVTGLLRRLIEQATEVLGIDDVRLDQLCAKRLVNRDDLQREWPGMPRAGIDAEAQVRRKLQLLRDLNEQVKVLGPDLGLGGEVPPQTPP